MDAEARLETDSIAATFLAQGEQRAEEVAARLVAFIEGAQHTLDVATYDFRLSEPLRRLIADALARRAAAGVAIRIAYDADKPSEPRWETGMDPAPSGTGQFVQSLGYPWRRIGGFKLMHHKYLVRDAAFPSARIWTGSTNLTDDSWTLQENNIVELASPDLAAAYAHDFAEMWQSGSIDGTGDFKPQPTTLHYGGAPAVVRPLFSPGCGPDIDYEVARLVASATRRVRICSMLLNSGALLAALGDVLRHERAAVSGVYDRTQMTSVLQQWQGVRHNRWKIAAVEDIIAHARLAGKESLPYRPDTPHNFMHNKVLVADDTVITGSYNFSHSAELNAENILLIENQPLADAYGRYIDHLIEKYGGSTAVQAAGSRLSGTGEASTGMR